MHGGSHISSQAGAFLSSWLPLQPYKSPLTFRQGKKSQQFALLASLDAFISRVLFFLGINLCNFCLMKQQGGS